MKASDWSEIERIFIASRELEGDEQADLLSHECAGNPELRRMVERMLAGDSEEGALAFERRLGSEGGTAELNDLLPEGTPVGPYRILRSIGEGGMGQVYLAERADQQYEQRVAIKLVRPGYRAAEMVRRFQVERQVLAQLVHPNIVPLLDGGVLEDGRPYLVLHYVDGVSIADHCDQKRLQVDERLQLFLTVCRAVQFAHSRLVVHRDLKPSNILVSESGEVHLLDFGIAKLLDAEQANDHTVAEARLLTPERAAPEQVLAQPITTATDVHGLGGLLFELLAGVRPFRLDTSGHSELERRICEEDAPRMIEAAGERLHELSELRGVSERALHRELRGDLDTIVRMALRKEPERRYASAGQLAEDVERYLQGLPVLAREDTWSYRLQRFVGRHRASVTFGVLLLALVTGFAAVTAMQSRRVAEERNRAELESQQSQQVVEWIVSLFDANDPAIVPGGDDMTLPQLLTYAEGRIEDLGEQSDVQARLWGVIGRIYKGRSDFERAEALLERAWLLETTESAELGPHALQLFNQRAELKLLAGNRADSIELFRESFDQHRRLLGEEHPRTISTMINLGGVLQDAEGDRFLKEGLERQRAQRPIDEQAIAMTLNTLGTRAFQLDRHDEARQHFTEALQILRPRFGDLHPVVLTVLGNLAAMTRDPDERRQILNRIIEGQTAAYGEQSVLVANAWNQLGVFEAQAGNFTAAAEALSRSLELWIEVAGEQHPRAASSRRNLGRVLHVQGRPVEAVPYLERAFELSRERESELGVAHVEAQLGLSLLRSKERPQQARRHLRTALETLEAADQPPPRYLAEVRLWNALALIDDGRLDVAESELRSVLELAEQAPGAVAAAKEARCALGLVLVAQSRPTDARRLLERGLRELEPPGMADPELVRDCRDALQ